MISSRAERLTSMSLHGMTVTPVVRVRSFRLSSRRFSLKWVRIAPAAIELRRQGAPGPELIRIPRWHRRRSAAMTLGTIALLTMAAIQATRRST